MKKEHDFLKSKMYSDTILLRLFKYVIQVCSHKNLINFREFGNDRPSLKLSVRIERNYTVNLNIHLTPSKF